MSAEASRPLRPSPWDTSTEAAFKMRLVAPRSPFSLEGKLLLGGAAFAAILVSLRFLLLGAWPVLVFSILDLGGLAVALILFRKRPVPEECLRIRGDRLELTRIDHHRRRTEIVLPVFWTRLETGSRSELDFELWLVLRRERHRIGRFVSAAERRALAPRLQAALRAARCFS